MRGFSRHITRCSLSGVVLLAVCLAAFGASVPIQAAMTEVRAITDVTPLAETVGLYEKFEVVIGLDADFANPYDPDDIRLDAAFKGPDGAVIGVPAFWYRHFEVADVDTAPRLTVTEDWSWRVRFAPTQIGTWQYRVMATGGGKTVESAWFTFEAIPSDNPGFVRVDKRNPRYFAFDDGTPYFPVGQNVAWGGEKAPLADYRVWLDEMQAASANFVRVWMAPWGFALEWQDTGLGNYDRRQHRARELDVLLEMLSARDIYMMLTLINHGQFSVKENAQWNQNPLNAANGGPLAQPADFATNPEAGRLWFQRLRYIAARWGYSTHIMTWEWWNEVEWTALSNPELLAPWIEASADYLHSVDPNRHLISHSGTPVGVRAVWGQPSMSYTQDHRYTDGDISNVRRGFRNVIPEWLEAYPDKPFLMGEFGTPSKFEKSGILIHQGLWAAPMLGSAGTAMTWWWDTLVHPHDLYHHFASVAAFFRDEDMGARLWQPTSAKLGRGPSASLFGLQAPDYALLWVLASSYEEAYFTAQFEKNLGKKLPNPDQITYPDVEGAKVTIRDLAAGPYVVEIWDAQTGLILESRPMTLGAEPFVLELPTFKFDLAVKIKPASAK